MFFNESYIGKPDVVRVFIVMSTDLRENVISAKNVLPAYREIVFQELSAPVFTGVHAIYEWNTQSFPGTRLTATHAFYYRTPGKVLKAR